LREYSKCCSACNGEVGVQERGGEARDAELVQPWLREKHRGLAPDEAAPSTHDRGARCADARGVAGGEEDEQCALAHGEAFDGELSSVASVNDRG